MFFDGRTIDQYAFAGQVHFKVTFDHTRSRYDLELLTF